MLSNNEDEDKTRDQLLQELGNSRLHEDSLQTTVRLYRDLVECASDGLLILNASKAIVTCNHAFLDIFGFGSLAEVQGKALGIIFTSPESYEAFNGMMSPFMDDAGLFSTEWTLLQRNGGTFLADFTMRMAPGQAEEPVHYVIGIRNLSLDQAREPRAALAATHDVLTGLPNRLLLHERISLAMLQARRRNETFTIILIDLDHFNHVNFSYGHAAGDCLLKAVALRLSASLRKEDTVARLNSDEFAVLLFAAGHRGEAIKISRKILSTFQEPFDLDGRAIEVSLSIGISIFPEDSETADELLRQAGLAMQRAKELGRNGYECYSPDLEYQMVGP